jgi:hypothetical protein
MQGAQPGTYELKLSFKLPDKAGTLSFVAENIVIKPKTKTSVSVTLYDYHISISGSPSAGKGLASYESKIFRYKGNTDRNINRGIPSFYLKGKHDKPIALDEITTETSGKIKPGTYDVLISLEVSSQKQKIWLENFVMKPDVRYLIATNLNGGIITYTGGNKAVTDMHLYPAGSAASQAGTPSPIKNLELGGYESLTMMNACPPGSYDVLLTLGKGARYEWKKNIIIKTGSTTEVR